MFESIMSEWKETREHYTRLCTLVLVSLCICFRMMELRYIVMRQIAF